MIKIHRMLTKTSNKVFRRKENDMVVIDKDENIDINNVTDDMCVKYGPDMFYEARPVIAKYGYSVGKDELHTIILKDKDNTYVHKYKYSGGVDMWLLNQYDCIFLHDCNEFSVELCKQVFMLWSGKRLVLVGDNWNDIIPFLPDIDIECWYEPILTQDRLDNLSIGMKCLHIMYGIPHSEPMDRYKQGIVYYDEVMALTFMFSDYREEGELNNNKKFFVINGFYGSLGLFTLLSKVETCALYAKNKGFVPVIRLTRMNGSFYSDYSGDDVWDKFFNQPEEYTIEEIMKSKHVYYSPGFYNGTVMSGIMKKYCNTDIKLRWADGIYNNKVKAIINRERQRFLPFPERTLGVLARGTDYTKSHPHNHPIHASIELLCEKIDEVMIEWNLEYIYVATEDASYCKYLEKRYRGKVYFTDQKRYEVENGQFLVDMHKLQKNRPGFELGLEYILAINLLSKCNSLVATGGCGGVSEAIKENNGCYQNVYVFDLGKNL